MRRIASNEHYFVVRAYGAAAVVWPAVNLGGRLWHFDHDVVALTWVVCYDIDKFEEIPLEVVSPLHLAVEDGVLRLIHTYTCAY